MRCYLSTGVICSGPCHSLAVSCKVGITHVQFLYQSATCFDGYIDSVTVCVEVARFGAHWKALVKISLIGKCAFNVFMELCLNG